MKENLSFVDSLRGWAALGVVLVHCTIFTHQTGWTFLAGTTGQRGVQLFYCLSAFTLCYSLDRRNDGPGNYFWRRFFRIAPLFYLAILANVLLGSQPPTTAEIVTGALFVDGLTPAIGRAAMGGWSISVEAIFYVLLPFLLLFIRSLKMALLLPLLAFSVGMSISWFCFDYFQRPDWSEYFFYVWFPIEFPVFCLGITAYFFWQRSNLLRRDRAQLVSAGLVFLAFAIFVLSMPVANSRLFTASCAFVPLIVGLSLHPWKAIVNPVTGFFGRISFSIYLVHPFVLMAAAYLHFPATGTLSSLGATLAFVLAGTVALSVLTHRWIEEPGIACGRTLIERRKSGMIRERLSAIS
jgi:peptidoglycan/LPS O-acetylase OafA/YrhL